MTNKVWPLKDRYGNTIPTVFLDNGDGTYTLTVSGGGGGGGVEYLASTSLIASNRVAQILSGAAPA